MVQLIDCSFLVFKHQSHSEVLSWIYHKERCGDCCTRMMPPGCTSENHSWGDWKSLEKRVFSPRWLHPVTWAFKMQVYARYFRWYSIMPSDFSISTLKKVLKQAGISKSLFSLSSLMMPMISISKLVVVYAHSFFSKNKWVSRWVLLVVTLTPR